MAKIQLPPVFLDPSKVKDVGGWRDLVKKGHKGRGFFCKACGANLNCLDKIPNDGRKYVVRCSCGRKYGVDAGQLAMLIVQESQRITKES